MDERPNEYRALREAPASVTRRSEPVETAEILANRFPKAPGRPKAANGGESEPSAADGSLARHDSKPSSREAARIGLVSKPSESVVFEIGRVSKPSEDEDPRMDGSRAAEHASSGSHVACSCGAQGGLQIQPDVPGVGMVAAQAQLRVPRVDTGGAVAAPRVLQVNMRVWGAQVEELADAALDFGQRLARLLVVLVSPDRMP